ncbi:hypothetical protein SUGI_1025910 [Cryptomeria japonica]|nr:hypothetical protein SUGI_1025910 [Cryptomeria japonica]
MGSNRPIFVLDDDDDDDDDVVMSISGPFNLARNSISVQNVREPAIKEEDLELRLGLAGTTGTGRTSTDRGLHHKHLRVPANNTIDLSDEIGEDKLSCFKRNDTSSVQSKEPKLTCAICMSAMKEETSTVCGHIFCKKCITSAIQCQKKCPTCRTRLTLNKIHRIYLFSSTD